MPIKVECPRCGRVTHYADNDAGLAAACIGCKTVIRVPAPQPIAKPAPRVLRDPSQELHLPPAVAPAPAPVAPQRRVAPAAVSGGPTPAVPKRLPVSRIAASILLLLGLSAAVMIYVRNRETPQPAPVNVVAATMPATRPVVKAPTTVAVAKPEVPAPVTQPVASKPPVLLSSVVEPAVRRVVADEPTLPRGFIGLERVQVDGKFFADSYNSSAGEYDDDKAGAECLIASNGSIAANSKPVIKGSLRPGASVGAKFKDVKVSGSVEPLTSVIIAPPVKLNPFATDSSNHALPEKYYRNGRLNLYRNAKVTLPAGTYYLEELVIDNSARLEFEGPVTLYIHNRMILIGKMKTFEDRPANCRLRMTGESQVVITDSNTFHFDLYAPRGRVEISGKGDIFGAIVGRTLHVTGSRNLHFDEALLPPGKKG